MSQARYQLDLPEEDERELTLAFQRGDKGAYQAIYERYSTRVESVCRRLLTNPDDAKEATQETFVKTYLALGRFNGRYQLGSWITRIATNVCLDHLRAGARHPEVSDGSSMDLVAHRDLQDGDDPEELFIKNVESRRVVRTLRSLPAMHRAAIVLRDIEGLSYSEIAIALELSDSQVKALLHRARRGFKKVWQQSGVLSALIPTRLLHRIRQLDAANDHASSWLGRAVESAQVQVMSCSSALQQCGQLLNERAAAVTAAVVTVAVVGGATVASTVPAPASEQSPSRSIVLAERTSSHNDNPSESPDRHRSGKGKRQRASTRGEDDNDAPAPATDDPAAGDESDAPAPTTEPEDDSGVEPQPTPADDESPSPSPVAPLLHPAVGFIGNEPVSPSDTSTNDTTFVCSTYSIDQHWAGGVRYAGTSYPGTLTLAGRGGDMTIALSANTPDRVDFLGTGQMIQKELTSKGFLYLQYRGKYDSNRISVLPSSGAFTVSIGLDCGANRVITESVELATH